MADQPTIRARPTTYKGIEMRSRLEADYAAWLDKKGRRWTYEPKCFAGPEGQYLPDFRTPLTQYSDDPADDYGTLYVEVKPYVHDGNDPDEIDDVLRRMELILLSESDAYLELVFWSYGASAPLRKLYRWDDCIWFDHWAEDYGTHHVWSGMGQWEAITEAALERLRKAGGG